MTTVLTMAMECQVIERRVMMMTWGPSGVVDPCGEKKNDMSILTYAKDEVP